MTQTDHNDFVPAIADIAREAGALLIDYFRRRVSIEYKGEADLVTEADRKSEVLIRERIRALWPRHDILGEEQGFVDTGSEYRWYVDPLDGTTNFAHGFPVFCVSMALEHKGQMVAGVIYDPTRDELFAAEKGSGAYLNQQRIHVSKIDNLAECLVATGFPSHKRHKNPNIFSIIRSLCARMECGAPDRLHLICAVLPAGVSMDFGSSTSIRGIRRRVC